MTQQTAGPRSWVTVTTKLESLMGPGRTAGSWTQYCCPVHEADGRRHRPSLGAKYLADAGRTKIECYAGCPDEQILDVLGLQVRDLYDTPRAPGRGRSVRTPQPTRAPSRAERAIEAAGLPLKPHKPDLGAQRSSWHTTDAYEYARADGTIAGVVRRREARFEHGTGKEFVQRSWNASSGAWEPTGFEKIPFRLPQVLDAIADGDRVLYLCEGEKDVLAAESAGLVATTNAGGALGWTAEHAQWLHGAPTVIVVIDQDAAGYRRAEKVMSSLAGVVPRVRVVGAATGKDLHDHLQCGHEIADLVPVPGLDPFTPISEPTPPPAAGTNVTPGGTPMPDYLLMPSGDAPAQQSDDLDNMGMQWRFFMQALMQKMFDAVREAIEQKIRYDEMKAQLAEEERLKADAEQAAKRAAAEARLRKLREKGLHNASRTEIVEAVRDAATWADDSDFAKQSLEELAAHVEKRYGLHLDASTGTVTASAQTEEAPELVMALRQAEIERADQARLRIAQNRMVQMIAAQAELADEVKEELYGEVAKWVDNPTSKQLDLLSKKLKASGVGEETTATVRLVAVYLGQPGQVVPLGQLGEYESAVATRELRRLPEALVSHGEEAKARVDELLVRYQDALRVGGPTTSLRERLSEAVAVMDPEDQQLARERGTAIRSDPTAKFTRLWPDHVDRDELASVVRVYATLAPKADLAAGQAAAEGTAADPDVAALAKRAAVHRKTIEKALDKGKGLHDLERDQLRAMLADVEAGKSVTPELMWLDERTAASVDRERSERIAQQTARTTERQAEQILESGAAPVGAARRSGVELKRVIDAHTQLAAGRANLPDVEQSGRLEQLDAKLHSLRVPEGVRHRLHHHLDQGAGDASVVGKQARRIAEVWAERRDAVVEANSAEPQAVTGYDSEDRRARMERDLKSAGLSPAKVAQRMAADAGAAHPASAATQRSGGGKKRTTRRGAGVQRTHHRGKGQGPSLGR
ncbi:toprim domain-containing protein [Nocardia asteroides]|uniref:toprim domain-containing protein n=1 Tax=Nocardia asteroides TaxID=1824 RepID=UPI0037BA9549